MKTLTVEGVLKEGVRFAPLTRGRPARTDLVAVDTMRAERRGHVLDLRRQHVAFDQIAARLGISATQARDDFHEAIRDIPRQALSEYREAAALTTEWAIHKAAELVEFALTYTGEGSNLLPRDAELGVKALAQLTRALARQSSLLGLDSNEQFVASQATQSSEFDRQLKARMAAVDAAAVRMREQELTERTGVDRTNDPSRAD